MSEVIEKSDLYLIENDGDMLEISADTVRAWLDGLLEDLPEALTAAFDQAQGDVHSGKAKVKYIILKVQA